jgi:alkylated DNA repair dioxygenase AlkB
MPGTPGAETVPSLTSVIDPKLDLSIVKSDYSAFVDTQLLIELRTRLITHIYVCGSLSNISVYATVLDAVRHGMEVTLIEDCLGYIEPKCYDEAVRQMADDMGAAGTDFNELMDDLSGLLGDVIKEDDFKSRYHVTGPRIGPRIRTPDEHSPVPSVLDQARVPPSQRQQQVEDWISSSTSKRRQPNVEIQGTPSKASDTHSNDSQPSVTGKATITPEASPPRKRSTSDLEDAEEGFYPAPLLRSSSRATPPPDSRRTQRNKPRLRNTRSSQESSNRPPSSLKSLQSKSTGDIPDNHPAMHSDSGSDTPSGASPNPPAPTSIPRQSQQQKKRKKAQPTGPPEVIGSGDCRLITSILPAIEADGFFHLLKDTISWQKMYHRSGEVPRLVAVQGCHTQVEDGVEVPIYRHPADESPECKPFDLTVGALRLIAEKHVGHELNHVLIQWYRSGEDNISEHSDKTLDIVRGSSIVNMSFGAERIMTLRSKKEPLHTPQPDDTQSTATSTPASALTTASSAFKPQQNDPTASDIPGPERIVQRIPLPHPSLFILGPTTNTSFLHSIRADKRPIHEKSPAELAFDENRISLTFRNIGTFVNVNTGKIWGQGATSKEREGAKGLLKGHEARRRGEEMIRAFGVENHSTERYWDLEGTYGGGWDVVDFEGHEMGKSGDVVQVVGGEDGAAGAGGETAAEVGAGDIHEAA